MLRALMLIAAIAAPLGAGAGEASGATATSITILEGEALVYRGAGRLLAAEGLPLAPGDIVETAASTFLQMELPDRSVAQLGPSTRALLDGAASRGKAGAERSLYVLQGWAKVRVPTPEGRGAGLDVRSPWAEIAAAPCTVVLHVLPAAGLTLFVESGPVRVAERGAGAAAAPVALSDGALWQRKPGARGEIVPRATSTLLQDMPRPFRDSLPLRAERWREQPAVAKAAPDFAYADVEPWLKAEPAVRKPLLQRWKAKAKEGPFRAALIANLAAHPEWDPILFPEKYLPKHASAPAGPR
jgi:hypothetical protein